eukprot:9024-Heterococcus_DN1.PRE.2
MSTIAVKYKISEQSQELEKAMPSKYYGSIDTTSNAKHYMLHVRHKTEAFTVPTEQHLVQKLRSLLRAASTAQPRSMVRFARFMQAEAAFLCRKSFICILGSNAHHPIRYASPSSAGEKIKQPLDTN